MSGTNHGRSNPNITSGLHTWSPEEHLTEKIHQYIISLFTRISIKTSFPTRSVTVRYAYSSGTSSSRTTDVVVPDDTASSDTSSGLIDLLRYCCRCCCCCCCCCVGCCSDGRSLRAPPTMLKPRRLRCSSFSSTLKPMRSLRVMIPTTRLSTSTTVRCRSPSVRNTM